MQDIVQLSNELGRALKAKGLLVTTAESCTGGGIAQAITEVAGSSEWFVGGFVAYANTCKVSMLGVSANEIATHGAVSEAVAKAMASGALVNTKADIAISTTGIAGPGGAVPGKPVGTVWVACATAERVTADCQHFDGDRQAVRQQTIVHALNMLLQCAQDLPKKT